MPKNKTKITDHQLNEIYLWVDTFTLSRPKKSISRDFSDGVLMAEILNLMFPRIVDLHNYFQAHNYERKMVNWRLLQKKVFVRLGLNLKEETLGAVANSESHAIEILLWEVKKASEAFK